MEIKDVVTGNMRVAIIANSPKQRLNLTSILESNHVQVVPDDELQKFLAAPDGEKIADVLLVDLDESDELGNSTLDVVMETTSLPILFNDSASTRNIYSHSGMAWGRRLASKLVELARKSAEGRIIARAINNAREDQAIDNPVAEVVHKKLASNHVISNSTSVNNVTDIETKIKACGTSLVSQEKLDALNSRKGEAGHPEKNRSKSKQSKAKIKSFDLKAYRSKLLKKPGKDTGSVVSSGTATDDSTNTQAKTFDNSGEVKEVKPSQSNGKTRLEKKRSNVVARKIVAKARQIAKTRLPGDAERVWVLGASIGGPEAVKEFVSHLPGELPIGFVLVQHIGPNFVPVLANQLNRVSQLNVRPPDNKMRIKNGEVIVSPVKERLAFDQFGDIAIKPVTHKTTYSPSIDEALLEVAKRYGNRSGAIIFSGMGDDGMRGVRAIANNGGVVWAQQKDTCVISSMADNARKTGCVQFSASPKELAQQLVKYLAECR